MFHIGILEDDKKELDWLEKLLLFSWKDPVKVYPFDNGSRLCKIMRERKASPYSQGKNGRSLY